VSLLRTRPWLLGINGGVEVLLKGPGYDLEVDAQPCIFSVTTNIYLRG